MIAADQMTNEKQKGQSFVELALITPLVLGALMVAVDFGIALYMGNLIAVAAREGARIGSELEKSDRTDPVNPTLPSRTRLWSAIRYRALCPNTSPVVG
jgi:Flp pilus assembly protein TadG